MSAFEALPGKFRILRNLELSLLGHILVGCTFLSRLLFFYVRGRGSFTEKNIKLQVPFLPFSVTPVN